MTDKHIPASKLEELPTYCKTSVNGYMDSELVLRSKILALIDEAPEVEKNEPFGYVLSINGELVFRKTITEIESLVYSSMAVYCGDHRPVPSSVIDTPPTNPDLTKLVGELVEALDMYSGCFGRLSDEINALVTRAKEYLKLVKLKL